MLLGASAQVRPAALSLTFSRQHVPQAKGWRSELRAGTSAPDRAWNSAHRVLSPCPCGCSWLLTLACRSHKNLVFSSKPASLSELGGFVFAAWRSRSQEGCDPGRGIRIQAVSEAARE